MSQTENPYSSPRASRRRRPEPGSPLFEAELLRNKYLKQEDALQRLGFFLYLAVGFFAIFVIVAVARYFNGVKLDRGVVFLTGLFAVLCPLFFVLGRGLRRLDPRIVLPVKIWSFVALLLFPVGTLFGGVALFLLFSEGGKAVFTDEYREAKRLTSEIKPAVPMSTWVKLGVSFTLIILLAIGAILSRK